MKHTTHALSLRVNARQLNHHLWNNHGTWFVTYTLLNGPFKSLRRRESLGTSDVAVARERRDALFAHLAAHAGAPDATASAPRFSAWAERRAA
jgi:hypothetical protein